MKIYCEITAFSSKHSFQFYGHFFIELDILIA